MSERSNNSIKAMGPLFQLTNDLNTLLPHLKNKLMSGTKSAQLCVIKQILEFLQNVSQPKKGATVRELVKFDMISTICEIMQTSNEDFVKVVLECFELMSIHEEFYDNRAAINATESMIRLCYLINKSHKDSAMFEKLVQNICNILVRSLKLTAILDTVCVPKQIISFFKNLDIQDLQKIKIKFAAVTMLNVVLQQATLDESIDAEVIIDVCRDALKSMTDIVKYGDDKDTISRATILLCGTCAGGSRFCIDLDRENQIDTDLKTCKQEDDLSICIYNTMMSVIIPYVKDADLSGVDSIEFQRNLVSSLNNLYQLRNCNHDNLSNYLAANGYLKYFLRLTVQLPELLRRSTCTLLSRILSILGKTAFTKDTSQFANNLREGLIDLPKDSERWNDVVAREGKDGMALMILLYYHFHSTRENDIVSLESLIARIMLLPRSASISILKPLWFLFAVTSLSRPRPHFICNYENAVLRLTKILKCSEIGEFYTHHVDLLHHCLKDPIILHYLIAKVLNCWLIKSEGDIRPLLPFNCNVVVRRLLVIVQTGHPERIISLAAKGLRHLIQIRKDDEHIDQIAEIVWHMLPDILSSYTDTGYQSDADTVAHIETVLELANIIQPRVIPIYPIIRSADNIVNIIILKKNIDSKLMILLITQAYICLVSAMSLKSFKVLEIYIQKSALLKILYDCGFSKERSQLSAISVKLLAFIIHCQKKSSVKCIQPLIVHIKNLFELLIHARKSQNCVMNGIQFIYEILQSSTTHNVDGFAVILQMITIEKDVRSLIDVYELLHVIHYQGDSTQEDMVYQCLVALLHFSSNKVTTSLPLLRHLCTIMCNYDLVSHVVNMRRVSCHFIEFVIVWLDYCKANCKDVTMCTGFPFKLPFDKVLDELREYAAIVNNKGSRDTYLNLQRALSQFE